jgi:hypothetical protein
MEDYHEVEGRINSRKERRGDHWNPGWKKLKETRDKGYKRQAFETKMEKEIKQ